MLEMKGGNFKSAYKAKCPVVPTALINSFVPFDSHTIKPVTVKVIYLDPIPYEEYKGMKTLELATEGEKNASKMPLQNFPEKWLTDAI